MFPIRLLHTYFSHKSREMILRFSFFFFYFIFICFCPLTNRYIIYSEVASTRIVWECKKHDTYELNYTNYQLSHILKFKRLRVNIL